MVDLPTLFPDMDSRKSKHSIGLAKVSMEEMVAGLVCLSLLNYMLLIDSGRRRGSMPLITNLETTGANG